MATKLRFARSTCTTADPANGLLVRLTEGDAWDADDPFVLARPDLFSERPIRVRRTVPKQATDTPVETATREPGQKRKTTRG